MEDGTPFYEPSRHTLRACPQGAVAHQAPNAPRRARPPEGAAQAPPPRRGRHLHIPTPLQKPCGRGRAAATALPERTAGVRGDAGRGPGSTTCAKNTTRAQAAALPAPSVSAAGRKKGPGPWGPGPGVRFVASVRRPPERASGGRGGHALVLGHGGQCAHLG